MASFEYAAARSVRVQIIIKAGMRRCAYTSGIYIRPAQVEFIGDTQQRSEKIQEIIRQTRAASKVDAHKQQSEVRWRVRLCDMMGLDWFDIHAC